ncbi:LOW QUALITY PROTEIN: Bromodomain domain-containing protein, partial [Cephalotus follicularis]
EDQSPAIKQSLCVEPQPLVDFLQILRSHKFGYLFERRLESQETPNCKDVICQHVDLETIRIRLEEGWYSGFISKFFRDLLLVFNNAIIFFDNKSLESMAAIDLPQLVLKEMAALKTRKPSLSQKVQSAMTPTPPILKSNPEPSPALLVKVKITVPLIACGKRSSITAKSSGTDKKRERTVSLLDEKQIVDWKQQHKSSDRAEEQCVTNKRVMETSTSNARKTSKNSRSRANTNTSKNVDVNSKNSVSRKGVTNNDNSESKAENRKKKNNANASAKKQSAAKFLNRMKRSSMPNNAGSAMSPDHGRRETNEQQKNVNGDIKGDSRKDKIQQKSLGGNCGKSRGSSTKRTNGQPLKRVVAPTPMTPSLPTKRGREGGEKEAGLTGHPKTRSRK